MTRAAAIAAAERYFDEGGFVADLARRVAIPTESQVEERLPVLRGYLADEIAPSLARLGFASEIVDNPVRGGRRDDRLRLWPWRRHSRARTAMARRAVALAPAAGGRPALRPRHRRQQGPAHDQPRRARQRAEDARPARLQCVAADRDRRGDRLARAARGVPAI